MEAIELDLTATFEHIFALAEQTAKEAVATQPAERLYAVFNRTVAALLALEAARLDMPLADLTALYNERDMPF